MELAVSPWAVVADPGSEKENAAPAEEAPECCSQYFDSSYSAQTLCGMAYYAAKAGMQGLVTEVAQKPGAGGNAQRRRKPALGVNKDN